MKVLLKWFSTKRLAIGLIVLPGVIAGIYLFGFAADRYVSESVMTIKQSGDQAIGLEGLSSIFQVTGSNARTDLTLLQAHINSMDMLLLLDQKLGLKKAFQAPASDRIFRLKSGASQDEFLAYYRERIEPRFDDASGLLILRTQGFTPEQAQQLNRAIIEASEKFINQISQRLAQDQMAFAANELKLASSRLENAKRSMFSFQEKNRMLDPNAQAAASSQMTLELQARLSRLEADLRGMLSYMDDNSFQVRAVKQQMRAIQEQLAVEEARGTSDGKNGKRLNNIAGDFRELDIEVNFAEAAFKSATASMETARLESTRKMKSLVLVASPNLPDDAEYPRRFYNLLALLLGLGLLFGIARLMVATIEDHLD